MKRMLIVITISLIILVIAGCSTNKKAEKSPHMNFLKEEISLSIKEESLTNTGVTLILENNSDIEVQYGNPYEIEVKKDGKWEDIDVKIDFTLQAFILEPKKYATILLNWEDSYGELEEGEYRILKDISYDKGNENYETFYVSVEFTIQ